MAAPSAFVEQFQKYLSSARTAQAADTHHDFRRQIFLAFLSDAFGIESEAVDVEKFLRIDARKKGWIDALFRDLVFEFKRDFERERADGLRELYDYLRTLKRGAESVGLLTDGLRFEVYTLSGDKLIEKPVDVIDLGKVDAETAFLWLDAYLFSQKQAPPTSADIVRRFGSQSPTFQAAAKTLRGLLERMADSTLVQTKRTQWRAVLAKVYGSDVGSDELFVRHTFLNQFAKLLAYAALGGESPRDDKTITDIIDGGGFRRFGVSNLGEIDFFAWVLDDPAVRAEAADMFRRLAHSLTVYDLRQVNEDLLKQLYQDLVDPETRHDLGEFYTPDWLAELTLEEIDYRPGQSLLDPSCGSGTFFFLALRRLADKGLRGWDLVNFALANVAGMDVHPLAVTVARINYLLAITPHMRGSGGRAGYAPLPVYMADALQTPEETGVNQGTLIVTVDAGRGEYFNIPGEAAAVPTVFNDVIGLMDEYARESEASINLGAGKAFGDVVRAKFVAAERGITDASALYWGSNLRLLNRLIREGRNSIWAFMLKNTARPLLLSAQKFDVIVGNPPWLSYRFVRDKTYKDEVKRLTFGYGLLTSGETSLFTQMDLSTLFMAHCEHTYLKPEGLIAFVMPRSVITGAKQHRRFQARGLTRVLDLLGVRPLFNVPTAVMIKQMGKTIINAIPTTKYSGRLPRHQMPLSEARSLLQCESTETALLGEVKVAGSYYYDAIKSGAGLFPRNLCFIKPEQMIASGDTAFNPAMITDPDVDTDAKVPWKGIKLSGTVYEENRFATLLSKNLLPFGYRKLHMVALPFRLDAGKLLPMDRDAFLGAGKPESWREWFAPADKLWDERKTRTSQFEHLIDQYNYMQKLTYQRSNGVYKLLYNSSGVHLAACVMDTHGATPLVYEYPTQGFIADYKTYCFETESADEAHYLCALLNAPCVDFAIKKHQSRGKGKVGERDISRTPFEACAIQKFDAAIPDHMALARLSKAAHEAVAGAVLSGQVVKARKMARASVEGLIAEIDGVAKRVLGL